MRTRLTAAVLTVLAMLLLAPAALAAPPAEGTYPPLPATAYAKWRPLAPSYEGIAVVKGSRYFFCNDAGQEDGPLVAAGCVQPSAMVLTYVKWRGRWVVNRVWRTALGNQAFVTRQYAAGWNWIWSPSLGLRLVARSELLGLATDG